MALTFLPGSLVIESDASILDLPALHADLRDWEDSPEAVIYPVTHTWKALDLGGGAFFYGLQLVNGWRLRFPVAGNYQINGNLGGDILPVAGVYVERKTSAAFATTAVGGGGPSAADVAAAVWAHFSRTLTSTASALTAEQATQLQELHRIHGLESGVPLVVTPTQRTAGAITQDVSEAGDTVTVERA